MPLKITGLTVDTVSVSSPATLAGDVTVGVSSPADLAGDITVGVSSPADLAGDITVGVASSADPVSVVTASVAFREQCRDNVMFPTDCVGVCNSVGTAGVAFREECGNNGVFPTDWVGDCHTIAEVAPLDDLASDVTISVVLVTSLADSAGVVTVGDVIPSDSVCDYDDYFYDAQSDDKPDYCDYDDPVDYEGFPSVYGYFGPDGCGRYYVCRDAVSAPVSRWN